MGESDVFGGYQLLCKTGSGSSMCILGTDAPWGVVKYIRDKQKSMELPTCMQAGLFLSTLILALSEPAFSFHNESVH